MDGKYCIPKINPSFFFPHKRRLHLHPFSSSQGGNITGLRCSELLSSKDEGPKRSMSDCARWDLRGDDNLKSTNYGLRLIANCKP